jgi:hypothetical protein
MKKDADRLAATDLEAAAGTGCRAVHLDPLADVALEDLGHREGVDDIASRKESGAERSGLAAADESTDERPVGCCQPVSRIEAGYAGAGIGVGQRHHGEGHDERKQDRAPSPAHTGHPPAMAGTSPPTSSARHLRNAVPTPHGSRATPALASPGFLRASRWRPTVVQTRVCAGRLRPSRAKLGVLLQAVGQPEVTP